MEQIVADASVILKFFVKESDAESAEALRDAFISKEAEILIPSLLPYEVINGIRYSKAKRFSAAELKMVMQSIEEYGFIIFELNNEIAERAIEMLGEYKITFYDAVYVALADITKSIFYTADEKLIRSVKLPFIKHVREFKTL